MLVDVILRGVSAMSVQRRVSRKISTSSLGFRGYTVAMSPGS